MIEKMNHASFTVSNMEASLHFFCDQLGLEATPIMGVDAEVVQTIIGMPGSSLRISNVSLPDGSMIELIEYVKPRGKSLDLATCNTGVAHLAFNVSDIHGMYRKLSEDGVEFVNPPIWDEGMNQTVCYLRGPDGITFEFIEKKS